MTWVSGCVGTGHEDGISNTYLPNYTCCVPLPNSLKKEVAICPLADRWMNKRCYICTMKCYLATKENKA